VRSRAGVSVPSERLSAPPLTDEGSCRRPSRGRARRRLRRPVVRPARRGHPDAAWRCSERRRR
jgi:hypothetical protein